MKPLPKLKAGDRFNSAPVTEWNNLIGEVERLRRLSVGFGLNFDRNEAGYTLSLDPAVFPTNVSEIYHVALVKEPVEGAKILTVRQVKYKDAAPIGEDDTPYEWAAVEDVEAIPEFGFEAMDFKRLFWDLKENPKPTLETPFFKLQRNYKQRMVAWFPGARVSEFRFAIVRDVGSGTQFFVKAQAVRWTGSKFETVGEAQDVATYPGVLSKYYEPFVWVGSTINIPDTPLLRVFSVDGETWLEQSIRWAATKSAGNINLSDCTPIERIS